MSENNNQNPSANAPEQSGNGGKGRHHHHRRHRGEKNKHHTPNEAREKDVQAVSEQEKKASQQKPPRQKEPQSNQAKSQQKKQDGGKDNRPASAGGEGNRNGKKRNRHGRSHHGRDSRPFDPYEQPSREEIELSELRAQIVMRAADGTVPTAYGSTSSKPAAEEIEIDEATVNAILDGKTSADTEEIKKVEVVGIRFRSAGKTYYFSPNKLRLKKGDFAVVETARGPEFGDVCLGNTMIGEKNVVSPLRPILRVATKADVEKNAANRELEQDAIAIFREKITAHKLEMKAIDAQYAFDGSKILFYFSSDGRVDFRELVKDLASVFHTRIELRQIGIRDEAKLLGGIGACGRSLCCASFLPDFVQVSIKMAKDQNLSLNSSKISGVCGRLMCCLRYEADTYAEEIKKMPPHDATVRTEDGVGHVISSNPLAGTVRVILNDAPDTAPKQYHRDSITVLPKEHKPTGDGKDQKKKS